MRVLLRVLVLRSVLILYSTPISRRWVNIHGHSIRAERTNLLYAVFWKATNNMRYMYILHITRTHAERTNHYIAVHAGVKAKRYTLGEHVPCWWLFRIQIPGEKSQGKVCEWLRKHLHTPTTRECNLAGENTRAHLRHPESRVNIMRVQSYKFLA